METGCSSIPNATAKILVLNKSGLEQLKFVYKNSFCLNLFYSLSYKLNKMKEF